DTVIDSLNATWNQVITPVGMTVSAQTLMSNNPTWQIWVGDDDACPTPSGLADVACTIKQPITESQLRAGQLIVTNRQSCNSVTITCVCVARDRASCLCLRLAPRLGDKARPHAPGADADVAMGATRELGVHTAQV